MTKAQLKKIVDKHTTCASDYEAIWRAVEAYSSASNDGKPLVSGSACDCKDRRELFERYQCVNCGALHFDRAS